MHMANHRPTVWADLVEQNLHAMGQQRSDNTNQQSMVARPLEWLAASARGQPAHRCENEKDFLIRTPSQRAGDLLRNGTGMLSDYAGNPDIRLGRLDGDRQPCPVREAR
jgi:hypothetical protein